MLAKWWNLETCSFRLSTGEATITLEDVWRIMRIPINGELAIYDPSTRRETLIRILEIDTDELCIMDYEI